MSACPGEQTSSAWLTEVSAVQADQRSRAFGKAKSSRQQLSAQQTELGLHSRRQVVQGDVVLEVRVSIDLHAGRFVAGRDLPAGELASFIAATACGLRATVEATP